jgi:hypothetical protein
MKLGLGVQLSGGQGGGEPTAPLPAAWSITPTPGGLIINSHPGVYAPAWSITPAPGGLVINSYPGM